MKIKWKKKIRTSVSPSVLEAEAMTGRIVVLLTLLVLLVLCRLKGRGSESCL